ncbi:unnamed protein product [Rhizophagus irregularis]|nr:unnamed protein product [Rhizophagus irregularis]
MDTVSKHIHFAFDNDAAVLEIINFILRGGVGCKGWSIWGKNRSIDNTFRRLGRGHCRLDIEQDMGDRTEIGASSCIRSGAESLGEGSGPRPRILLASSEDKAELGVWQSKGHAVE